MQQTPQRAKLSRRQPRERQAAPRKTPAARRTHQPRGSTRGALAGSLWFIARQAAQGFVEGALHPQRNKS
jgi:hypothetical protein